MRILQLFTIMAMLLATAACKPDAADADATAGVKPINGDAIGDSAARGSDGGSKPQQAAAAPGGAFAREPGFQLPVPVSSTPVRADNIPQSRQVDPIAVRTAVMEGMEASGGNVQVQVNPAGIVSLSGEVGTVADQQAAHYLARAQPGVVEVDYRNLRVRQR